VGSPPYVQISGGEPLTRTDVYEVIQAVRGRNRLPIIIFVTNGSLLEVEKYQQLLQAGIDRISISLDFPDDRHDQFRRCPGLFQHLSEVVPRIATNGYGCNIALNTAITKANFRYVCEIANKAQEWGVGISYSAYTPLRTGDETLMLSHEDALELDKLVDQLIMMQSRGMNIVNPPALLKKTVQYFKDGQISHCGAGKRFFVIRPDGTLNPCSYFPEARYNSLGAMQAFVNQNQCGKCYVAIRAYTDRKITEFLSNARQMLKSALPSQN
jgi:MoaA/NifB/PqqE/SkfB family radical SAM enzyme